MNCVRLLSEQRSIDRHVIHRREGGRRSRPSPVRLEILYVRGEGRESLVQVPRILNDTLYRCVDRRCSAEEVITTCGTALLAVQDCDHCGFVTFACVRFHILIIPRSCVTLHCVQAAVGTRLGHHVGLVNHHPWVAGLKPPDRHRACRDKDTLTRINEDIPPLFHILIIPRSCVTLHSGRLLLTFKESHRFRDQGHAINFIF